MNLGSEPGYHFPVYPADPTPRVAAKGTGENKGFVVGCVDDTIQRTKSCKLMPTTEETDPRVHL